MSADSILFDTDLPVITEARMYAAPPMIKSIFNWFATEMKAHTNFFAQVELKASRQVKLSAINH